MRLIAWGLTLVLLGVCVFAGERVWRLMSAPPVQVAPLTLAQTDVEPQPPTPSAPPRAWPAAFGTYVAPEPQPPTPPAPPPPTPEPQPPAPPLPPLDSLGYRITGIISAGDGAVWAMVAHPTGALVLRAGDPLGEGMRVARIDATGVWLDRGGDAPELLAIEEAIEE